MTDEQIIDLYWSRDESAIKISDEKYGAYCFSVARSILDSSEDCEECVNDTWFKSWQAMPPSRPKVLKMFFAKITRNLSLDRYRISHARKRGSGQTAIALEELSEIVPAGSDVESEIDAKELGATINRYLHELKERDCNIFLRRYFYVEDTGTIAAKYGLTEKNVQMILYRARARLKEYLEKEGYTV